MSKRLHRGGCKPAGELTSSIPGSTWLGRGGLVVFVEPLSDADLDGLADADVKERRRSAPGVKRAMNLSFDGGKSQEDEKLTPG